jgi:hypothetical protein
MLVGYDHINIYILAYYRNARFIFSETSHDMSSLRASGAARTKKEPGGADNHLGNNQFNQKSNLSFSLLFFLFSARFDSHASLRVVRLLVSVGLTSFLPDLRLHQDIGSSPICNATHTCLQLSQLVRTTAYLHDLPGVHCISCCEWYVAPEGAVPVRRVLKSQQRHVPYACMEGWIDARTQLPAYHRAIRDRSLSYGVQLDRYLRTVHRGTAFGPPRERLASIPEVAWVGSSGRILLVTPISYRLRPPTEQKKRRITGLASLVEMHMCMCTAPQWHLPGVGSLD